MRLSLIAAALSIAFAGCGTAAYTHKIEVTINDPSNRLGGKPAEVSVFDHQNGMSEEWARKTIGTTAPGALYTGEAFATATRMIYDTSPPPPITAGVYLPALQKDGYFRLDITPVEGPEQATTLTYYAFQAPAPEAGKIPPVPARFTSKAGEKGWTIHLALDVPPAAGPRP